MNLIADLLFALLVRLYPPPVRQEFGREMLATLRQLLVDRRSEGRPARAKWSAYQAWSLGVGAMIAWRDAWYYGYRPPRSAVRWIHLFAQMVLIAAIMVIGLTTTATMFPLLFTFSVLALLLSAATNAVSDGTDARGPTKEDPVKSATSTRRPNLELSDHGL